MKGWASSMNGSGRWPLERKVAISLGSALLLLALISLVMLRNMRLIVENNARVARSEARIAELDSTFALLLDAQESCTFYVLTGEGGYLQSYQEAVVHVQEHLHRLAALSAASPKRRARLSVLQPLMLRDLSRLQSLIDLRQKNGAAGVWSAAATAEGRRLTDEIRQASRMLEADERELIQQERNAEDSEARQTAWLSAVTIPLAILIIVLAGSAVHLDTKRKQAEQERDRFWALSHDLLVVAGLDGYVKRLSASWETTLGYTSEELMAKPYLSFLHPDDREMATQRLPELRPSDGVITSEVRILRKDGSLKWISWKAIIPVGTDAIYAVAQDITERKRAEAEMHELLASIVRSSDDAIFSTDLNGTILNWNGGAERIFGYTADEIKGQSTSIIVPPELAAGFRLTLATLQRGENIAVHETKRLRKDGRRIDVALTLSVIRDATGTVTAIAAIARDITEQKAAEAENRRLATAVEQAAEGVTITDVEGQIQYVNPAFTRMTGYSREEVLGKTPRILRSGVHGLEYYQNFWRSISAGETWHGEMMNRRKDGSLYTEEMTVAPVRDSAGTITNFIAIKEDVTERKRAEAEIRKLNEELEQRVLSRTLELEEANRELEAFTYSVSHDLRAPLHHLVAFAHLLREEAGSQLPEFVERYLKRAEASAVRMERLIEGLLALSRVGRQELDRRPTCLNSLVDEALQELQPDCIGRKIEWRVGRLPVLECDRGLMKQVFINLLSNAVKFSREREHAVIEVKQASFEGRAAVVVRDNGIGFDMRYAQRLFGAFQRLHRAEEFEGTGVGLATVQRIIHRHGGKVWAEAELDKGATFYFSFPRGIEAAGTNNATAGADGDKQVLVVEDNAEDETLTLHELRKAKLGLRVHVVRDGEEPSRATVSPEHSEHP